MPRHYLPSLQFCSYTLVYAFWKACLLTTWYRLTGGAMSFHSGGKGAGGATNKNTIPAAKDCKGPVVKVAAEDPSAQKPALHALPAPGMQHHGALPANAQVGVCNGCCMVATSACACFLCTVVMFAAYTQPRAAAAVQAGAS